MIDRWSQTCSDREKIKTFTQHSSNIHNNDACGFSLVTFFFFLPSTKEVFFWTKCSKYLKYMLSTYHMNIAPCRSTGARSIRHAHAQSLHWRRVNLQVPQEILYIPLCVCVFLISAKSQVRYSEFQWENRISCFSSVVQTPRSEHFYNTHCASKWYQCPARMPFFEINSCEIDFKITFFTCGHLSPESSGYENQRIRHDKNVFKVDKKKKTELEKLF